MSKSNPKDVRLLGRKLKSLELGKPVEILGNTKTLSDKKADLIICEKGVYAISKKTRTEYLIFDSDCMAAQLLPEAAERSDT